MTRKLTKVAPKRKASMVTKRDVNAIRDELCGLHDRMSESDRNIQIAYSNIVRRIINVEQNVITIMKPRASNPTWPSQ